MSIAAGEITLQCAEQPPPEGCADNVLTGNETDVDCGGSCPPCEEGWMCNLPTDCASGVCGANNECVGPPPSGQTFPVHVHVITSGAQGQVSQATVQEQIDVLNAAYGPIGIQFNLASLDYTDNAAWYKMEPDSSAETQAKNALHVGGARDLNLYVSNPSGGVLGWASYPWWYSADPKGDGVVVLTGSLPGGFAVPYDLGKTAASEVGHWLGLYNVFQGGCLFPDDEVKDTPRVQSPTFGCPAPGTENTCIETWVTPEGSYDPKDATQNLMNYTDDACRGELTPGQAARIAKMIDMYRAP